MRNVIVVFVVLAIAGLAYYAGTQSRGEPDSPAAIPTIYPAGAQPGAASGSAPGVNPDAHFTHYRVGRANVKTILADGDLMWVGTSNGVIRYDTVDDKYQLFDTRSGLLANGIFHLSKLHGRLIAGTYGGGLSHMKEDGETWKTYNIPYL